MFPLTALGHPVERPPPECSCRGPAGTPAADWLEEQRRGWAAGTRFAFAVTESRREDELLGNAVMKQLELVNGHAEMGYWTTAPARGRGVVSQAAAAVSPPADRRGEAAGTGGGRASGR
ncbi:GNAT family N-acetyltransferase [Streptomyces globisporus]